MLSSFPPMYRLTARGGVGLACDERGIALGPVPLVEVLAAGSRRVFRPRPAEEIARTLALAYGRLGPDDLTRCLAGLDIAARALEADDLVKAKRRHRAAQAAGPLGRGLCQARRRSLAQEIQPRPAP